MQTGGCYYYAVQRQACNVCLQYNCYIMQQNTH